MTIPAKPLTTAKSGLVEQDAVAAALPFFFSIPVNNEELKLKSLVNCCSFCYLGLLPALVILVSGAQSAATAVTIFQGIQMSAVSVIGIFGAYFRLVRVVKLTMNNLKLASSRTWLRRFQFQFVSNVSNLPRRASQNM